MAGGLYCAAQKSGFESSLYLDTAGGAEFTLLKAVLMSSSGSQNGQQLALAESWPCPFL